MSKFSFNILAGVNVAGMKKGFSEGVNLAKGFGDSLIQNFSKVAKGQITLSKGIGNVGNSFKALAANPVGLALLAIVGTLKLLHSGLSKSAEGQRILAGASGVLTGIMQTLNNIITDITAVFIKLFKDPKTAMADFGKSIKTAVMKPIEDILNGVKFLGSAFKKLFKGDVKGAMSEAKKGANEFKDAFVDSNPILIMTGKLAKNIANNTKKSVDYAQQEHDLYIKETAWIKKKAELEKSIAENRLKLTEGGLNAIEAAKTEKQLRSDLNALYGGENDILGDQIAILAGKQALGENTKEDNRELAELQATQTRNLADQNTKMIRFVELFKKARKEAEATANASTKIAPPLPELDSIKPSITAPSTDEYDKVIKKSADASIAEMQRKAAAEKAANAVKVADATAAATAEKDARIKFGTEMFNELGGLEQQLYARKSQKIDDQAAKEIEAVTNSTLSEEEKAAKIKNIQTKADLDKRKIDIKSAKAEKRNALIAIAVNTAVAISKVLGQTGIFGLAAWIPIAALGAVQAATVASQPIPKLADGGIAYGNSIVNVGEYAGASSNPEVIAPLDKLKSMLQPTNGANIISVQVDGKEIARAYDNYNYKKNR